MIKPFVQNHKAHAALSNDAGRFESCSFEREDDGWGADIENDPKLKVETRHERARSAITYNTSPDLPFDRSVNPYRGCEHGCIYCFARPSHAYLGLSPGLDFETRLIARPNIADALRQDLNARRYVPAVIAMGTNTDPYQPIDRDLKLTRACLRVLAQSRHPVAIVTKGTLIERDIDILQDMARDGLARVGVSVTTLDPTLSRKMEPRAPSPKRRLLMIERLAAAGIEVRIMASPMVPGLSDHELESILEAGQGAGATLASWIMLRLPREVSALWQDWLAHHFPHRAERVMSKLREMHGGKPYDARWGHRMRGTGEYAELVDMRFRLACKRLGLRQTAAPLRTRLFQRPSRDARQLSLL
ncbi:MAG: PA0069 family radical SAM protein [Pseudomonadota bacterium]